MAVTGEDAGGSTSAVKPTGNRDDQLTVHDGDFQTGGGMSDLI